MNHPTSYRQDYALSTYPELAELSKNHPVEFYVEQVSPRLLNEDITKALAEIRESGMYSVAVRRLKNARVKFKDSKDILDEVERRLTEATNRVLTVGFGISWTITSFVDDVEALAVELGNDHGDRVKGVFEDLAQHILDLALTVEDPRDSESKRVRLKSEEEEAAERWGDKPKDEGPKPKQTLMFVSRTSVTLLPWTLEQMSVVLNGTSAVTKSILPELHSLIDSVYHRTQDYPVTFNRRYLKTSDGIWLELDMSHLMDDTYLVTQRDRPN